MSFVTNILTPIIVIVIVLGFVFWILFWIYYFIKHFFPSAKFFIWYKIFKKNYNEKDVFWCMQAEEKGYNPTLIKKELLKSGTKQAKIDEIIYIFNKINQMKGGHNGRQTKEFNGKDELPTFK